MNLRPEFLLPELDEDLVARLTWLANELDGARPETANDMLLEFNQLASTNIPFVDFQDIYEGEDHDTWVRRILLRQRVSKIENLTLDDLTAVFQRFSPLACSEPELSFLLAQLEYNLADPQISGLIFWPGEYLGDGDNSRELTPEEMAHIAWEKATGEQSS
jgi:hypothetical protein